MHIHQYRTGVDYFKHLKERMEEAGITQTDLAHEMGVHIEQTSRLFSGRVPNPHFNTVVRMERAFRNLRKRRQRAG